MWTQTHTCNLNKWLLCAVDPTDQSRQIRKTLLTVAHRFLWSGSVWGANEKVWVAFKMYFRLRHSWAVLNIWIHKYIKYHTLCDTCVTTLVTFCLKLKCLTYRVSIWYIHRYRVCTYTKCTLIQSVYLMTLRFSLEEKCSNAVVIGHRNLTHLENHHDVTKTFNIIVIV